MTPSRIDRAVRLFFQATLLTEGVTWCGLLVALAFKYLINGWTFGVTVFGWIHGVVWLAVVLAILLAAVRFRWPIWLAPVGLAMSVLPFLTLPFEWWMRRADRLRRAGREAEGAPTEDAPVVADARRGHDTDPTPA
ncbi:DUF3817 domain-containing protein [Mycetocola reblochoni]|uniref:Inner membrane protein n=2 Tax=Mycetocola reblochoni TaxID=331618 RepID=A0A1R4KCZ6_9MICO|nr:DUF3817 domain-containing protein [Mycetocola reblochoni]RLP71249.1 DUF3817 domain-containing protein [Mycetocola reblochoni]SJN42180.1 inner membrane protein [Mycetocola reblochoni REB411]